MNNEINQAASLLFSTEGRRVSNIKFYLGSRREITDVELAREFIRAERSVVDASRVDVAEIDGDLNA